MSERGKVKLVRSAIRQSEAFGEMRRRGFLQIVFAMLSSAKKGARKTHIMIECGMNHAQFKLYLSLLVKRGLIKKEWKTYRTTDKGVRFMKKFREMEMLLKSAR